MNTDQLMTLAVNKNGFIFDPANGVSYTVNDTGLFILKHLQKGVDKDDIIPLITEEYDVNIENARSDIEHYMSMLKALHLVDA
ncbi:MAG: PqqD family protein [Candidatus Cloacimonetes bacterium]|nr:PqqD family protein [Candidatus Cloacimonadota bacterium]